MFVLTKANFNSSYIRFTVLLLGNVQLSCAVSQTENLESSVPVALLVSVKTQELTYDSFKLTRPQHQHQYMVCLI